MDDDSRLVDRAKPYLPELENRTLSLRALAATLGTNETYLCRVLKPLLKRKQSSTEYRKNRGILKKTRAKYREMLANDVKKGLISIETAAETAHCSVRTLYRYLARA